MSNDLGVANVSEALRALVESAASASVAGAQAVLSRPPASPSTDPRVYVVLFRAAENASWRSSALPERRADGKLLVRPRLALDLYYLLCFQGDDTQYVPARLFGRVMTALHAEPLLGKERLRAAASVLPPALESPPRLSTLPDDAEPIRLTHEPLDLEQISKIWSVFLQTGHLLAASWKASVVLLEPDADAAPPLPVTARELLVTTMARPRVHRVRTEDEGPFQFGATLIVEGSDLAGEGTRVAFGESRVTPAADDTKTTSIRVAIPEATRAGPVALQVVQVRSLGSPPTERTWTSSNACAFLLRPVVRTLGNGSADADATEVDTVRTLTVRVDPAVGEDQQVWLVLTDAGATTATSLPAVSRTGDTHDLSFDVTTVPAGTAWVVRVRVDGAESVPTGSPFDAPWWTS